MYQNQYQNRYFASIETQSVVMTSSEKTMNMMVQIQTLCRVLQLPQNWFRACSAIRYITVLLWTLIHTPSFVHSALKNLFYPFKSSKKIHWILFELSLLVSWKNALHIDIIALQAKRTILTFQFNLWFNKHYKALF